MTNQILFNIISNVPFEKIWFGVLAQLGEHLPYKQRVIGSSPIGPIPNGHTTSYGGIAQLARAHGSYPWCRGFKSPFRYYQKRESEGIPFLIVRKEKQTRDTTGTVVRGVHNVRWTLVLDRPKRSEDQIPLPLLSKKGIRRDSFFDSKERETDTRHHGYRGSRGPQRPVDVGSGPTEAKTKSRIADETLDTTLFLMFVFSKA